MSATHHAPDRLGSLWLPEQPLLLASASVTRRAMLIAAGLPVDIQPAQIDERAVEQAHLDAGAPSDTVAATLAGAKALHVSALRPDTLVLGADQTLTMNGRAFHKPANRADVITQLRDLSSRTHQLTSAFALARGGVILGSGSATAQMTMRALSDDFIGRYLAAAPAEATATVGGYQLERLGSHLFSAVAGDHFTVLGLPLLAVLAMLRDLGALAE
ncbi:MAG: Maf family protein [Hyphomicrobiales bacterium]|nr:Maf family protein [Hyphomicrobiales bacterium]